MILVLLVFITFFAIDVFTQRRSRLRVTQLALARRVGTLAPEAVPLRPERRSSADRRYGKRRSAAEQERRHAA